MEHMYVVLVHVQTDHRENTKKFTLKKVHTEKSIYRRQDAKKILKTDESTHT